LYEELIFIRWYWGSCKWLHS